MAMDLNFLIGAQDQTGPATVSARNNINTLNKVATESGSVFDRVFSGGGNTVSRFFNKVASGSAEFLAIGYAAKMAFEVVVGAIEPGIEAIDKFTTGVVSMAAQITSFKGGGDIAQTYQDAKKYATGLAEALEEIDARTIASAQDLNLITGEMMKQRVLLDVNNQKQVDGFVNLANAVAVVAQGAGAKEIQIRQEVRALLNGEVNAQSQLASQVNAMVGGGLKQKVELWKQEGTLIEHIGGLLQGYAAAQGDISATWGAVKSTTETVLNIILRAGFKDIFKDLVGFVNDLNDGAKENAELIGNKIQQAWLATKGLIQSVGAVLETFKGPLGVVWTLTKLILEAFGLLLYAVLPPLLDRVAKFGDAIWSDVKVLGNLVEMLWRGLSFDFTGAYAAFENAKANFAASGKKVGDAFATGLSDEISTRASQFLALDLLKGKGKGKVDVPDLGKGPASEEERKAIGQAAAAVEKYGEGIKALGKARLDLASREFNTDLQRQADLLEQNGRVFGEIRGPVNAYLDLISQVEAKQTKLQQGIGQALDELAKQRGGTADNGKLQDDLEKAQKKNQVALLAIEKAGAEERLKVWTSYYDSLKGVVEKKEKEIQDLQEKMMAARVKIADAIEANNKKLLDQGPELDAYTARLKAIADIRTAIDKATNGEPGKGRDVNASLKALDDLIAKAQELTSAVSMDGQDVISQVDAVKQSNELLVAIGAAQDKLHQDTINQAEKDVAALKGEMKNALDNIATIRSKIEELDDRIAKMQTSISLVADDKVSPVLDKIKATLDYIRNATVTISASYVSTYPGGGINFNESYPGYASGTAYVSRTGLYQLHQGEEVRKRLDVSRDNQGGDTFTFGDLNFVLPNVTNQTSAAELARQALPEFRRLLETRFKK